jgi:Protein of unknown function (DUF4245)
VTGPTAPSATDPAGEPATDQPSGGPEGQLTHRQKRERQGFRDIALSAVILGLGIWVVALIADRHPKATPQAVDISVPVQDFAAAASYQPLVPTAVPQGWTATSVRRGPGAEPGTLTLHIGWVTARHAYAALEETGGDRTAWLVQQLPKGRQDGSTQQIGGVSWEQWRDAKGAPALVSTVGSRTVVLNGGATQADLAALAGGLTVAR